MYLIFTSFLQAAQHGHKKRVLLVVGKGHVPGLVYCLLHPWRTRMQRQAEMTAANNKQEGLLPC